MQQPELGRRLSELRKEKNLTQEELVERSHVSVRTIQRIEAGEVVPRTATVKILLEALGQPHDSLLTTSTMKTTPSPQLPNPNTLLIASISGIIYLVLEVLVTGMDVAWMTSEVPWAIWTNTLYIGLSVLLVVAYTFFMRGFLLLATVFENTLLKIACYMLIIAIAGASVTDIYFLSVKSIELLWIPYSTAAVLIGALSIVFGIALIRLQDSMGEISRIAGMLEIILGCTLVTVILFIISYVIMVPAIIVEVLVLYKGYEYLSRNEAPTVAI